LRQLIEHDWGDDDLNPLGARTLASAVVASLDGIAEGARTRAALRQLVLTAFATPIAEAIERADSLLEEAGVTPAEPVAVEPEPVAVAPEPTAVEQAPQVPRVEDVDVAEPVATAPGPVAVPGPPGAPPRAPVPGGRTSVG